MDHEFMELLLDQTHFPQEARQELHRCVCLLEQAGQDEALEEAVAFFYRNQFDVKVTEPLLSSHWPGHRHSFVYGVAAVADSGLCPRQVPLPAERHWGGNFLEYLLGFDLQALRM